MSALGAFVVAMALKGSALLALGFAAARALRRAPARELHRIWAAVVAGVLALPLLMAALPGWPVLPLPGAVAAGSKGGPAAEPTPLPFAVEPAEGLRGFEDPAARAPTWVGALAPGAEGRSGEDGRGPRLASPSPAAFVAAAWLAGAVAVLLRLLGGLVGLSRLGRGASAARDPLLRRQFAALAARAGVRRRRIRLLISEKASGPATWGLLRPVVLLPGRVARGPAPVREAVLLHELLHVRRHAWAVQLLALAAAAVHWFNPLAWTARRRLVAAEEGAVDDAVVRAGIPRAEYAARLVEVARALGPAAAPEPAVVTLASASSLEARVRRLLGEDGAKPPLPPGVAAALPLVLLAGLPGLAAVEGREVQERGPAVPVAIAAEPFLSVGVAEGEPAHELHRVVTPFLLPDGRLAVPLAGALQIRLFGPGGELVERLGRPGQGPGEFASLDAAWARGDTVEAFDGALRRITRFLPKGGVEVISLAGVPHAQGAVPGALPSGWILAGVAVASMGFRDEVVVQRVGRDGSHLGELARLPAMLRYADGGGSGPHPLSPGAFVAVGAGRTLLAESLTPEIHVYDARGEPRATFSWEPDPLPAPAEALRTVLDSALAREGPEREAALRRSFGEAPVPDRLSALWGLLADPEGFTWVRPYDPVRNAAALGGFGTGSYLLASPGPGGEWRILGPDGEEADPVAVPEGLEVLGVTREAVVGLRRDALGVESVHVHRLERR